MPQTHITDLATCTHCKAQLDGIKILVRMEYEVFRSTNSETWESVDNSHLNANEMLCKDCFDKFVNGLDAHMQNGD